MVRVIDPEPDGLYEKYRVFKEPTRDSQGNEPAEHPVSLDPPLWRTSIPEDEHFVILEELGEVQSFTFVLKPDNDPHARVAIAAYAWSVKDEKPALFRDLMEVLSEWGDGS